jgi:hypothetical protein
VSEPIRRVVDKLWTYCNVLGRASQTRAAPSVPLIATAAG